MKKWIHNLTDVNTYVLTKAPYFRNQKLSNWIGKETAAVNEKEALSNFRYRIVRNAGIDINRNRFALNEVQFPEGSIAVKDGINDLNHKSLLDLELDPEEIVKVPEVSDDYAVEEDNSEED